MTYRLIDLSREMNIDDENRITQLVDSYAMSALEALEVFAAPTLYDWAEIDSEFESDGWTRGGQ